MKVEQEAEMQTRNIIQSWVAITAILFCVLGQSVTGQESVPLPLDLPPLSPAQTPPAASPSAPTSTAPNASAPPTASAPKVSYVVENGVRYRVTRAMVRQPVQDVRYVERPQTFYEQRLRTDAQQVNYYTQVPVTQYECVPRLYDWWRVFQGGYVAYGMEPYTTYQTQPQSTTVPITRREVRPVTKTVKVAQPYLRFEERELVSKERVDAPVASAAPSLTPSYIPPSTVPNVGFGNPGFTAPRPFIPSNLPAAPSIPPRDTNPFGGFSVAAPVTGRGSGLSAPPAYIPPASASGIRSGSLPTSNDESRYGGVARFDGDPPRYGTGSLGRR